MGRERAVVARLDRTFPWYIGGALVVAVAGGFALALVLPLAAALRWDWGIRWRALVQAHGHLQVTGWVGLFVVGMAFRLVPRFAGRPLRAAGVALPALLLLLSGMLGRAVAQPWLELSGMPAVLTVSALAELAGALLFAVAVVATLAPVLRTFAIAPLLLLGAAGLVVQSLLGAIWLSRLDAALPAVPPNRDAALLSVQFYAFLLPMVLGVSLRALPTLFAFPPPARRQTWSIAGALALGTALHAAAPLMLGGTAGVRVEQLGALLIAAAMAGGIARTGVWRPPARLRASARHTTWLIRTAYAWLAAAAATIGVTAATSLGRGRPVSPYAVDAVRHMLALGVFSTLIAGMAHLVLPWLAMRRQRQVGARREMWMLWTLFTGATVLRVIGALLGAGRAGTDRYWPMALSGLLGITAVTYFAVTVLRAARQGRSAIDLQESMPHEP